MVDCTAQKCPSHAADVQPADLGKHIEHIVPVWLVQGNGFRNDFHLVPQSHTGQTGTSSGDLLRRQLLQNGKTALEVVVLPMPISPVMIRL